MAKLDNYAYVGGVKSNGTEIYVQDLDLTVTKLVNGEESISGYSTMEVTYTITATNNSSYEATSLIFKDTLESGHSYIEDSFTVNGESVTPTGSGQLIMYTLPSIEAGASVVFEFKATID